MKRLFQIHKPCIISIIFCGMIFSLCINGSDTTGQPWEKKIKENWVKEHLLGDNPKLPFSFIFDGKASSDLLKTWQKKTETNKVDINRTQYIITWTDNKTGLEVRCLAVEYSDFSVIDWTVYFKNTGTSNTPILKDIQGLDSRFEKDTNGKFVLHGNKGDWCVAESYEPYHLTLDPNMKKRFAPVGGRPTNGPEGWPYYNLQMPGGGLIIAVGWPGQWATSFVRDDKDGLRIVAGQEQTNLYLKPGERIRTPFITLQFWQGTDTVRAQNLWRRYFLAHIIPTINDKIPQPMSQMQLAPSAKGSEEEQLSEAKKFEDAGIDIDLYWNDAGWYPCDGDWEKTGTWEIDAKRYPNGFKPIADWVHYRGKKLIVWFEPERVGDKNSYLAKRHPEWLLGRTLLNMGIPEARKWVVERVDSIIKENEIDYYRQDFNIDPLSYWRKNDSLDRQGVTENFYVQGYLNFWDILLQRHQFHLPLSDLLIDACASGGRRNDLETMRRAVPLLRSDFQPANNYEAQHGQTYGLSSWIPYYGSGVYAVDKYAVRSFYMPSFGLGGNQDLKNVKVYFDEWRKVGPLMLSDYYPLTSYSLKLDQWIAWQFNRVEKGDGLVQAFRRDNCDTSTRTFLLNNLDPAGQYEITDFDVEGSTEVSGKVLMEKGLTIDIKDKPGAAVITYKKIK
jgi:alpha-galactosidase